VVNTKRANELITEGRIQPAGQAAFDRRDTAKTEQYTYEARRDDLAPAYQKQFQANKPAWAFFQAQPPGYRRTASAWVMSAKQEATRLKRLAALIADSANGERLAMLRRR